MAAAGHGTFGHADRFAVLMISVRRGDRSLPLVWRIEEGEANIGFAGQRVLLEQVGAWLPEGAAVMLLADRFSPSAGLLEWVIAAGWQYRLRLKGEPAGGCRLCGHRDHRRTGRRRARAL